MSGDLRTRLHDEMSTVQRPQLGGLVQSAVVRGQRVRQVRRTVSGLGAVAAAGTAVAVIMLGGQVLPGQGGRNLQLVGPAGSTTTATRQLTASVQASLAAEAKAKAGAIPTVPDDAKVTRTTIKPGPALKRTVAPVGVRATAEGLLELLTRQLPAGTTSHYGRRSDAWPYTEAGESNALPEGAQDLIPTSDGTGVVQLYVMTSSGTAMLRASLFQGPRRGCPTKTEGTCEMTASGDRVVVMEMPDNCVMTKVVQVVHSDGSGVQFHLSTCLERDGKTNQPAPPAITVEKAIAMGKDTRMDMSMDPKLVSAGAKNFPSLHVFR